MSVEIRPDLGLIPGYHSAQVDVAVRLNTNEAPESAPLDFARELAEFVQSVAYNRYPDREATELRAAIAEFHGVRPDQVFAANGSNEVLQCLLLAFGGPGRSALVFEPTYMLHSHIPHITGTKVIVARRNDDFSLDPSMVTAAVGAADPSVVFLCSPNNPTGLVESPEVLDAAVAASTGLVIVDEAYGQFSSWSAIDRVAENKAIRDDLEGVGIYDLGGGRGYIVVSSQGNNTYAVYRREGDHAYLGSFAVVADGARGIDGISETDGLEVTSRNLGPGFEHGAMIAQDGRNVLPTQNQNYKYVTWESIARALKLEMR